MTSNSFVTIADVPIGYTTPKFPSLYWPVGNSMYKVSYLYYTSDIWRFTVFWTLIFFVAFYGSVGIWASFIHRKFYKGVWMIAFYSLLGAIQALISGTILGLVISAIYKSGLFSMSTWIPMCCGVVQILLNLVMSYPMLSVLM